VGGFDEFDAREHLTQILKLSDEDIEHVLDNIGANPAAFEKMGAKMAREGISVQDFVALQLKRVKAEALKELFRIS
jgi:hypothetical protein